MNLWHRVNPECIKPDNFLACIEIPQGSKNKYELAIIDWVINCDS